MTRSRNHESMAASIWPVMSKRPGEGWRATADASPAARASGLWERSFLRGRPDARRAVSGTRVAGRHRGGRRRSRGVGGEPDGERARRAETTGLDARRWLPERRAPEGDEDHEQRRGASGDRGRNRWKRAMLTRRRSRRGSTRAAGPRWRARNRWGGLERRLGLLDLARVAARSQIAQTADGEEQGGDAGQDPDDPVAQVVDHSVEARAARTVSEGRGRDGDDKHDAQHSDG